MALTKRCRHPSRSRRRCGCAWYARISVEGQQRFINVGSDYAAARVAHARLVLDREEGRMVAATSGPGVAALCDRWYHSVESNPDSRANSLHTYRSRLGHVRRYFGDVPVASLGQRQVREFVNALLEAGLRPATVGGIYAALRSVFVYAQEEGLLEQLPLPARSPVPRASARSKWPGLGDCASVIRAMEPPWDAVAEVCLLTGLRIGEAMALQPADIDAGRRELHVRRTANRYGGTNDPKSTSGERIIPLSPRAVSVLEGSLLTGTWPRSDYRRAYEALRTALDARGLHQPGLGWHWFRNAHRSLLREAGVELETAARRMGHGANLPQTMRYGWHQDSGDGAAVDQALTRHDASRR